MRFFSLLLSAVAVQHVTAIGFAIYKEIGEYKDRTNAGQIVYQKLDRANALFLYIQLVPYQNHDTIISDFKTLCSNYGSQGVQVIPRVRYGTLDGEVAVEPDEDTLMADVEQWAGVFGSISKSIIPVVQVGFLGQWGEWHDSPFAANQGNWDTEDNRRIKTNVVNALKKSGHKLALRYPKDHLDLFENDLSITIHDDCIFDEGPGGSDGWTFPPSERETLVEYTLAVASGNTFGGEGCAITGKGAYDWWNYEDVCGSNGLANYIHQFNISYLNPYNPDAFKQLYLNPDWRECSDEIQHALESYN